MGWRRWQAWAPACWSLALALLLLGPALGPGLVLTYDMVWVPDLAVRPDVWGLGSALPRAVPSDAVVAVLDEVVPGAVLQHLVLLGLLVAGGTGAARLLPGERLSPRLVAVSAYVWTPFVAERLLLGAWPVLVLHGLLPWLVLLGRRWRTTGRLPPALLVVLPLGCLSASAGVAAVVALLAATAGPRRPTYGAVGLLAAANAPWVVTGLTHAADATSDRVGAEVFALDGHGVLPAPLEALALGGTWNSEVVLPARGGVLAWVGLVLLVAVAATARSWWRATGRRDALALVVPWSVGLVLALVTWAAPGAVGWVAATVPGGGLLRDGARSLVLCAPLVAVLAGHAAGRLVDRLAQRVDDPAPRAVLAGGLVLVPLMLLPDAALGLAGRLGVVETPASYAAAREAAARVDGDALVLPLTAYRAPAWNDRRPTLDPMPRWLRNDAVASDRLLVDTDDGPVVVAGEDPRVAAADRALAAPTPEARATALAALGIAVVVVERDAGEAPEVAGRVLLERPEVTVLALADPAERDRSPGLVFVTSLAWAAYAGGPLAAVLLGLRKIVRTIRRRVRR
ncbi:hypothetical protein [Nocardioides litoris]|uniref:hypothetical protein n=1 Tax=Nocardioides litoris TaxID=1926648 RepID=UPI00111DE3E9|nr:hypothetical protein [Nocardioides litoris]